MKTIINTHAVYAFGDKTKPPIVFVHGFLFDHTMWKNQVEALSNDYYCVTYDLRGFGDSYVGDGQYTMEAYVSDLFSIITELNLVRPVICGLSLGGYIAIRTLERDQSRFKAAMLLNTRSEADSDEEKLARAGKINEINLNGLKDYVNNFYKTCFAEKTYNSNPALIEELTDKACRNNPRGVKGGLFSMMSRTDTTHFLPEIDLPVQVIAGEFDQRTPAEKMEKMAAKIKGSEFHIIREAGHLTPLEKPEEVNGLINTFLKSL